MRRKRKTLAGGIPTALELIMTAPLFAALTRAEQETLAEAARRVEFEADSQIFARGDSGLDVFLVADGRVRLAALSAEGKVLTFANAGRGDIFGEMAAFDGGTRSADATAMTDVIAYAMPGEVLLRTFTATPVGARAAVTYLCAKVRATSLQAEDIALHTITIRLARFILSALKLTRTPLTNTRTAQLSLQMSQAEIADLLGASRQKLNQALSRLVQQNVVSRRRNVYTCNLTALRKAARTD